MLPIYSVQFWDYAYNISIYIKEINNNVEIHVWSLHLEESNDKAP